MSREDFIWVAHLDDGTAYPEHGPDGVARGWASVPQARVISLELVPQRDGLPDVRIALTPEQTPVLFRRRYVTVSMDGVTRSTHTVSVIGWISDHDAHYWAAYPDGTVVEARDTTTIG